MDAKLKLAIAALDLLQYVLKFAEMASYLFLKRAMILTLTILTDAQELVWLKTDSFAQYLDPLYAQPFAGMD